MNTKLIPDQQRTYPVLAALTQDERKKFDKVKKRLNSQTDTETIQKIVNAVNSFQIMTLPRKRKKDKQLNALTVLFLLLENEIQTLSAK